MHGPGSILITGASSGIGRALAVAVRKQMKDRPLLLIGRSEAGLAQTADAVLKVADAGVTTAAVDFETDSTETMSRTLHESLELVGLPEVIVHCAGIFEMTRCGLPGDLAKKLVQVNLLGPMMLNSLLVENMIDQRRGTILFVNSTAAEEATSGNEGYSASKAGLMAYADALRDSLRPCGIGVITACPGPTWTKSWAGMEKYQHRTMTAEAVGEELAHQIERSVSGAFICEHIALRHVSGRINFDEQI